MNVLTATTRAALLAATMLTATAASAQLVVKSDKQWSSEGEYLAYASPWCALYDPALVAGRDYANTINYAPGALAVPANVQFTWRWPDASKRSPKCGVFGYNQIAWGNYEGGATMRPVPPRQLSSITDATVAYGVDYAADPDSFNGLIEFYATYSAGAADAKAMEIGWFFNAPKATVQWAKQGQQLGLCTDRYKKQWRVAQNGTFITFSPVASGQSWGTIDVSGGLACLKGKVSGNWWLNGMAIGFEPLGGYGTAVVRTFKVTIK